MVTAVIIGVIYVPYVAKPVRGQVLSLREREFVDAARSLGLGNARIMASEIAAERGHDADRLRPADHRQRDPHRGGLSYLGAGVQDPNPSWGTMISDGIRLIPSAIHLTIVPGLMLVTAVLGINVFGDGVRDALDPRAKVRIEHCMARFILHRLVAVDRGAVRDLGPDVPDLPGHPQRRSRAPARRPAGDAPAGRRRARAVGLRQADLRPVLHDDGQILTGSVVSYTQQVNVLDEIKRDLPATLSLAIGAGSSGSAGDPRSG